jgi:transcriptional regulator with XRE-family HTH domain
MIPIALKRKRWSQRRLEREIPVSTGYVTRLIDGSAEPSARVALRIQELLGVRIQLWSYAPRTRKPRPTAA